MKVLNSILRGLEKVKSPFYLHIANKAGIRFYNFNQTFTAN